MQSVTLVPQALDVLAPAPRRLRPGETTHPGERMEQISARRKAALEKKVEDLQREVRELQCTLEHLVLSVTITSRAASSQQRSQATACQHKDSSTSSVKPHASPDSVTTGDFDETVGAALGWTTRSAAA
eukprot:CAMPEP_0115862978 /NCGR_PEP_ID=MMETSP0287-20121206/18456_1 /TAXON_ID=412157 /ORGANISM="Chrysochromulina rotalis, Strain UIO044" /LENGTH=128 /DNA_ID=CAMNT_0003317419 /DNA_START=22 /DNA_END=408 /DNA_ORIENTATION=+